MVVQYNFKQTFALKGEIMASHSASKEARQKATSKYRAKTYYQVVLMFPKEDRERIKAHSEKRGVPIATLIKNLLYADMERGD